MLIGELSRRTGVRTHQLRYYEAQGLLRPERDSNGYRAYDEDAVLAVTQVRKLLAAGLPTDEIEFLLPCATGTAPDLKPCPELLDALHARLAALDAHIATLTRTRGALREYVEATEAFAAGVGQGVGEGVGEGEGQ
ncbi:MerR family transcriptional regulator [Streptomyces sp. NPDC048172]|uniref:MerR family transcriptional regulator n=1 Tax=Streptomyces sp. NPDC048172 TaxID=3365505 RepID=UPI00371B226D